MNEFANVTVATLAFPTDGRGVVSAQQGNASAGATTTYTANTAVDSAAGWTLTGVVLGSYAFTADGFWGIVQSYAPAAGNNVLTVDRWRKPGFPSGMYVWIPAAGGATTVHSTTHIAGSPGVTLKRIFLLGASTGGTVAITDQKGTNLSNFVFTLAAASAPLYLADYGETGLYFPHPIGFKLSVNTIQVQFVYDASGVGPPQ